MFSWGSINQEEEIIEDRIDFSSYHVTLLLSLNPREVTPCIFDIRIGSNTQWDFLDFVLRAVI